MEIIEHTLDDHKIFQILDVLDQDLFSNLQISKQKIYDFTGPNITSNEKVFYRIKNWKDLDSWEPHIGIDFVSYAKIIKNFFLNLNLNASMTNFNMLVNNRYNGVHWHKHHPLPPTNDVNKFWVAVFYHHSFWDSEYDKLYDGRLRVCNSPNNYGITFPCYANSVIIHNNAFGHCVDQLVRGAPVSREVCYTEWSIFNK